jgi:hypothetical protein
MSKRRMASTCARGFPRCLATLPPMRRSPGGLSRARHGPFYDRRSKTITILF